MSTPAPTTPDQAPRKAAGLNRSFTLPSRFTSTKPSGTPEIGATEGFETLYYHPNVKVLKFSTGPDSRRDRASASTSDAQQKNGTIPWASSSEQTVASGALEIYRVPGSVSFLRSGSLLHAIMLRSQCWCVDGVSKFAMRVLTNTYYRIELPGDTPEDLDMVEELKKTFQKVLHYERTACPFARTFTVALPEEAPVRQRRRRAHGPAKRWRLEKAYSWKPEDGEEPPVEYEEEEGSGSVTDSDEEKPAFQDEDGSAQDSDLADQVTGPSFSTPPRPTVRDRVRDFSARRSFTAPVQAIQPTLPSRLRSSLIIGSDEARDQTPDSVMYQAHVESRTFQAIPTDMPPSPPDSSAGFEYTEPTRQYQQTGNIPSIESQIVPPSPDHLIAQTVFVAEEEPRSTAPDVRETEAETEVHDSNARHRIIAEPQTPLLMQAAMIRPHSDEGHPTNKDVQSDLQENGQAPASRESDSTSVTGGDDPDPFAQIQARIQARRSIGGANDPRLGSYSPYHTPSTSIASRRPPFSQRSSHHQQVLTAAIVNKACAVFLGPPARLVKIMLRIAARLANGTFARDLFASPADESARIPGTFDLDGSDVENLEESDADVEEDDFGVPLRSPIRLAAKTGAASRGVGSVTGMRERRAWEVD